MKRTILLAVFAAILPVLTFAQTGKISGRVIDKNTGDPLIGANVLIEGSDRGAAANVDGEYVILNVPIGKVTLVAKYIGYRTQRISNVLVRSNETTGQDFRLEDSTYAIDVVEIVRERPLVEKNMTNTTVVKTDEDFENMPVRGIEGVVSTLPGVVGGGSTLYIRGSRSDQTAYVVDGVNVNNPVFGGRAVSVISNAIAEISYQAGGYSAEAGGANGGLISTNTKTGGQKLAGDFEIYSDAWGTAGKKFLGTYPYDNTVATVTLGGPAIGPVKFFGAVEYGRSRNPVNRREPINLTEKWSSLIRQTRAWEALPDEEKYIDVANQIPREGIFDPQLGTEAKIIDVSYPGGLTYGYKSDSYAFTGNLVANLNPITIRVGGSYAFGESIGGSTITAQNNQARATLGQSENYSFNTKLSHIFGSTFYEIYLNYVGNFGVSMDPDFKHDVWAYGDSIANANLGYFWQGDGTPQNSPTVFGQGFSVYGAPRSGYSKSSMASIQGKINFVHQIGKTHEIKVGGEASQYTLRQYAAGPTDWVRFYRNSPDATPLEFATANGGDYYGYDYLGNVYDGDDFGPKKPVFAAFYALDKIELEDLIINLGLRYDYIDTKSQEFVDPNDITFDSNGLIEQSNLRDAPASATVSPRLGFSFPVTDQTVFYAQYGVFVNQSRLRDVYQGLAAASSNISGGYAVSAPVGWGLRPEKTIQYDFGFRQQVGENLAFDIGAYYRDIKDQIQIRQIASTLGAEHSAYYAYVNGDFSTTQGFNLQMQLRTTERITAQMTYTFSDARGTGSNSSSSFYSIWLAPTGVPYFPKVVQPLDFDQTHTGSVNLDYRFRQDDGPEVFGVKLLERFGANLLLQFNSGNPYTRVMPEDFDDRRTPIEPVNSSTSPWVFYLNARFDKTVTMGPLDVNFYIWVINLLNTNNVEALYATTGSYTSNGYLASEEGQKKVDNYRQYGEVFAQMYQDFYYQMYLMNAGVFGTPRQIRLGLKVDF